MQLLLLFSLHLHKCSLIGRSCSRYTVNSRIILACLCLDGAGWSSPPPSKLYRLSNLLLFLLEFRPPADLWLTDLTTLIQGFPLFYSLGELEPRSQRFCSLHYCSSLQGVDQSSYGCRWFIPFPCPSACWLLCACITLCDPSWGSCNCSAVLCYLLCCLVLPDVKH